jgi:hypothetical protein
MPGWWQASDGNWYSSTTPPAPGWWRAADGNWYAPQGPVAGGPVQTPGQVVYAHPGHHPQVLPTNSAAKTGGVVGIVGAVLSLIPFLGIIIGIIMGILAIIFSSIGLSRSGRLPEGKGMATAGLVLGILTVIFKLIPGIDIL